MVAGLAGNGTSANGKLGIAMPSRVRVQSKLIARVPKMLKKDKFHWLSEKKQRNVKEELERGWKISSKKC